MSTMRWAGAWVRGAAGVATAVGLALTPGSAHAEQEKTVKWNESWSRAHWIEGLDIIALTIGSIAIDASPYSDHAKWDGPILFDKWARDVFKSNDGRTQELAASWSDQIYHGMVLAPYVIDNYIVALGVHQNADVALQMTVIDLQSLGLSGVMSLGAEHIGGRPRPYVRDCVGGPGTADKVGFNHCDGVGDFQSFYSGHAAATFTMAGLTCVHHQHLPLYGGGFPDLLACLTTVSLAATTGVLRLVSDRHWASDVLLGTTVGILNGYILPSWLHYGFGDSRKRVSTLVRTPFGYVAPVPQVYQGGAGLGLVGAF